MKLIGMLDSPYVRRVAISLQLLGLPFEHQSLSVFRTFDAFRKINPVVKAPTQVCDDGTVLMDSSLILQYAEALAQPRTLMPRAIPDLQRELRLIGLALSAMDKSVQIVYERSLRPPEKLHEPWLERVKGQLCDAYGELESELRARPLATTGEAVLQGGLTMAVAWRFTQDLVGDAVPADRFALVDAHAAALEALPAFRAAPHGESTYRAAS